MALTIRVHPSIDNKAFPALLKGLSLSRHENTVPLVYIIYDLTRDFNCTTETLVAFVADAITSRRLDLQNWPPQSTWTFYPTCEGRPVVHDMQSESILSYPMYRRSPALLTETVTIGTPRNESPSTVCDNTCTLWFLPFGTLDSTTAPLKRTLLLVEWVWRTVP